jgi:hypothetical protein
MKCFLAFLGMDKSRGARRRWTKFTEQPKGNNSLEFGLREEADVALFLWCFAHFRMTLAM